MDPLGSAPIFIALTAGRSVAARRRAALEAAGAAGGLVVVFALFGRLILDYLHVSVESLTIAGGMLLLLVALQMLRGEEMAPADTANVALVAGRVKRRRFRRVRAPVASRRRSAEQPAVDRPLPGRASNRLHAPSSGACDRGGSGSIDRYSRLQPSARGDVPHSRRRDARNRAIDSTGLAR